MQRPKGHMMNTFLRYSVLGLGVALGSSTFAHAEYALGPLGAGSFGWLQPPPHREPPPPPPEKQCPGNNDNPAPEVDPSLAMSGFTLLGGTLTVMLSRRTKRS